MKTALALAFVLASATSASAQYGGGYGGYGGYGTGSNSRSHSVDAYTNSRGTYVAPHYSTSPNNTQTDNYGTRGNYNPYTGAAGTRSPRY